MPAHIAESTARSLDVLEIMRFGPNLISPTLLSESDISRGSILVSDVEHDVMHRLLPTSVLS